MGGSDDSSFRAMLFFPFRAQHRMQALAELHRELIRLAFLVEGNGLADVIHDHLARTATGEVFLELFADVGVNPAIDVIVQHRQ